MQANFNIPDSENRGGLLKIYGALCETPETAKAMQFSCLLIISSICQLLADTFISKLVGNRGSDYAAVIY